MYAYRPIFYYSTVTPIEVILSVVVSATVVSATFSIPSPTINPLSETILPSPITALFSMPVYVIDDDFWQDKYAGTSHSWSDKYGALSKTWTNKY